MPAVDRMKERQVRTILPEMLAVVVLNDGLFDRATAYAERHGTTLDELIADGLQLRLADPDHRPPVVLHTFKGEGLHPGLDLDDMRTIYDRMDLVDGAR